MTSVAVVTGAADGIGWAVSQRLAEDFDHVVLLDLREAEAVARAAALGPAHWGQRCDVTSGAEVVAVVAAITPAGREAFIHLTITDEYPLAQAFVIIEAR